MKMMNLLVNFASSKRESEGKKARKKDKEETLMIDSGSKRIKRKNCINRKLR